MLRIKKFLLSPLVLSALFIAAVGVKPASFLLWYQPKPPEE